MDPSVTPEGLAEIPPGPALGAALAGVDLSRVANGDTVAMLVARSRQLAYEQARLWEAMVEVGRADPADLDGPTRLPFVAEWASGEIAAALTLTGLAADRELDLADVVVTQLPLVHAAMSVGSIDRARAWVFADHLEDVPAEQVAVICAALVPRASGLTTGQLRARLVRMLHDIDPEYARRRYRRAVRNRGVVGYLAPDGTVTVTATGLPADEAAVACERIDALAHAVQRAGHPGRLDQIQADLFLGMLEGTFRHHGERQIIEALLRRVRPEDTEPAGGSTEADADAAAAAAAGGDVEADQAVASPVNDVGTTTDPSAATAAARSGAARSRAVPRPGVEIRVGLGTVIGLEERCGEVPGLGPVLPGVARVLVAAQHHGAEWRFAVTDADGLLVLAGTTRRRPVLPVSDRGSCRGGVVEIHVSVDELARLGAGTTACGPWAGVIADLAGQFADQARRLTVLDQSADDRFARAALARHVEVRDRTCCFPGCRRPARRADKDHTRDYATGGLTTSDNIGPLCERHHRYKSEGWWTLRQPRPGRYRWRSPLARTYRTRGEPIRPPTVPAHPRPPDERREADAMRPPPGPILRRSRGRPPREPARPRSESTAGSDPPPFCATARATGAARAGPSGCRRRRGRRPHGRTAPRGAAR